MFFFKGIEFNHGRVKDDLERFGSTRDPIDQMRNLLEVLVSHAKNQCDVRRHKLSPFRLVLSSESIDPFKGSWFENGVYQNIDHVAILRCLCRILNVRDDLETWPKLKVTAFLMSGIAGANPDLISEIHKDKDGKTYLSMSVPAVIVLTGAANVLTNVRNRANDQGVETVAYIEKMFVTGHDVANCAVFAEHEAGEASPAGMVLRADKKIVDKITKGTKMRGRT